MSFAELAKQGRILSSGVVPDESRQSLPIPVFHQSRVAVDFLFFPSMLDGDGGVQLAPPQHKIRLDLSGRLLTLEAIPDGSLLKGHKPLEFIGTYRMPNGWKADDYLRRQARLYELLDSLSVEFGSEKQSQPNDKLKRECRELYSELIEPPVKDYYVRYGDEFFNWLDSANSRSQ
jgi:hypothetical protein